MSSPFFCPVQPLRSAIPQETSRTTTTDPASNSSPASPCFMLSCDRMTQSLGQLACADCFCGRFMRWRRYPWLASLASPSYSFVLGGASYGITLASHLHSLVSPPHHGRDICFCLLAAAWGHLNGRLDSHSTHLKIGRDDSLRPSTPCSLFPTRRYRRRHAMSASPSICCVVTIVTPALDRVPGPRRLGR